MALRFHKRMLISFLLALYQPFERNWASDLAKWILIHWGLDTFPDLLRHNSTKSMCIRDLICRHLVQKVGKACVPSLINVVRSTHDGSTRCGDLLYALRDIGGPKAMAFLIDMRKNPTERPDVAKLIRQIAEEEARIAKRFPEKADRTYIPALISLVKSMSRECVSRDGKNGQIDHPIAN